MLWSREQITPEMAIGQIAQNLVRLQHALDAQRQLLHASLEAQRQILVEIQREVEGSTKRKSLDLKR